MLVIKTKVCRKVLKNLFFSIKTESSCDKQEPGDFYENFPKISRKSVEFSNSIAVMLYKMFISALRTRYDIK